MKDNKLEEGNVLYKVGSYGIINKLVIDRTTATQA
jgi:hypothetical protein